MKRVSGRPRTGVFSSEQEANDFIADLEYKERHGIPVVWDSEGKPDAAPLHHVRVCSTSLKTEYLGTKNLKKSTLANYRHNFQLYLRPFFGDMPVRDVDAEVLNECYRLLKLPAEDGSWKGLSLSTANKVMTKLHTVFKQVKKWSGWKDCIQDDPFELFEKDNVPRREYLFLTEEELNALLIDMAGHPAECFVRTQAAGGLRPGEAEGLRWDSVNFEDNQIMVRSSRGYVPGEGYVEGSTKTSSVRTVEMPVEFMQWLKARYRKYLPQYEKVGLVPGSQYVCGTPDGRPAHRKSVAKSLKRRLKRIGYKDFAKFRLHDLRHTYATLLLRGGGSAERVGVQIVSAQLGHAHPGITLQFYAHVIPGDGRIAADAMGVILKNQYLPSTFSSGWITFFGANRS